MVKAPRDENQHVSIVIVGLLAGGALFIPNALLPGYKISQIFCIMGPTERASERLQPTKLANFWSRALLTLIVTSRLPKFYWTQNSETSHFANKPTISQPLFSQCEVRHTT